MKHVSLLPAILLAAAFASSALAEAPRIITLQGNSQATLPGAQDGARHGVKVFRGSGFPDPIVIEAPVQVEDVPAPVRKKAKKKKRKRGW